MSINWKEHMGFRGSLTSPTNLMVSIIEMADIRLRHCLRSCKTPSTAARQHFRNRRSSHAHRIMRRNGDGGCGSVHAIVDVEAEIRVAAAEERLNGCSGRVASAEVLCEAGGCQFCS